MEEQSLEAGGPRVKFSAIWRGTLEENLTPTQLEEIEAISTSLSDILLEMEQSGLAPVLPDGKVGGNAAVMYSDMMVVSKSGKTANQKMNIKTDICMVTEFDMDSWSAAYLSRDPTILPTSDTPLHYCALNAYKRYGWCEQPILALHGHALDTEEEALKYGLPCSTEETLFSTREDTEALLTLLQKCPYPEHNIFIRKGHGFILLAPSLESGNDLFRQKILPCVKS